MLPIESVGDAVRRGNIHSDPHNMWYLRMVLFILCFVFIWLVLQIVLPVYLIFYRFSLLSAYAITAFYRRTHIVSVEDCVMFFLPVLCHSMFLYYCFFGLFNVHLAYFFAYVHLFKRNVCFSRKIKIK